MQVPLCDRIVHRAHAIFDTLNIYKGRTLLMDYHTQRAMRSCEKVKIESPVSEDELKKILLDMGAFCYTNFNLPEEQTINIRYWISSGKNNYGILPEKKTELYIVAFKAKFVMGI